jgi:alpha-L-arabinofuranosidase
LVYKLWRENASDNEDNYVYTVSDDQRYIKTVIKVVDLTKGEIVKVGTIYEETTQSEQRVELAFDEAGNAYIKYGSYNFIIATD